MTCVAVLGASGGVGAACVAGLAAMGCRVAAIGRSKERLAAACGPETRSVRFYGVDDAGDPDEMRGLLGRAEREQGALAGMITAVGSYEPTPLGRIDVGLFREMLETNLVVPAVVTSAAAETLAVHGGGRIVHIGSITRSVSRGEYAGYEAAKAGLAALARSAAIEYAGRGVTVNVVDPGWIRTPMAAEFLANADPEALAAIIPVGRASEPEEVATAAIWLATRAPKTVTAQSLVIDGGQSVLARRL